MRRQEAVRMGAYDTALNGAVQMELGRRVLVMQEAKLT